MATEQKGRLSFMNMAYGFGAAIVLMGAMFKFLNYPYANILILIGFSVEALVFAISAFERVMPERTYFWERIFPQLTHENESPIETLEELIDQVNIDPMVIERLSGSIEKLEQNINQMSEVSNTAKLATRIDRMVEVSEKYEHEISKLSNFMEELNRHYETSVSDMHSDKLALQVEKMIDQTERFEDEIKKLNNSVANMSEQYGKMLEVMGGKKA